MAVRLTLPDSFRRIGPHHMEAGVTPSNGGAERGWRLMIFCARATRGRGPPRWTRAVEDQSAPTPWERASKLGRIILGDGSRSMRAVKGSLGHSPKERGEIRRAQSRINQESVYSALPYPL